MSTPPSSFPENITGEYSQWCAADLAAIPQIHAEEHAYTLRRGAPRAGSVRDLLADMWQAFREHRAWVNRHAVGLGKLARLSRLVAWALPPVWAVTGEAWPMWQWVAVLATVSLFLCIGVRSGKGIAFSLLCYLAPALWWVALFLFCLSLVPGLARMVAGSMPQPYYRRVYYYRR